MSGLMVCCMRMSFVGLIMQRVIRYIDFVFLGTVVGSMLDPTVQLVVQFSERGLGRPLVLSGY